MAQTPTDRRFQSSVLEAFVARALTAVGLPSADAEQVARLMILADLRGSDGHGIFRLSQYVRRIRAGGMNLQPNIHVVQETEATAAVDGDNRYGAPGDALGGAARDGQSRTRWSELGRRSTEQPRRAGGALRHDAARARHDRHLHRGRQRQSHASLGWSRAASQYESDRVHDSGFPRTADRSRYRHQRGGV